MKELSAESIKAVIESKQPQSLSQLAHHLGYKGGISSSVIRKLKQLVPDIAELLAKGDHQVTPPKSTKTAKPARPVRPVTTKVAKKIADKPTKGGMLVQVKAVGAKAGKWPRDPRNPFREGAYGTCFDILAAPAHKDGLLKEKLIQLLAEATGKNVKHAGYDAQVLLSAKGSDGDPGLSNNDSPRHRSCRPGFWIKRTNGHVQLLVDKG